MALNPQVLLKVEERSASELGVLLNQLRRVYSGTGLTRRIVDDWVSEAQGTIAKYGTVTAALAAASYLSDRIAARVTGRFTVPLAEALNREQSNRSLRWSIKDLFIEDPEDVDFGILETKVQGVGQRLIAQPARQTVYEAIDKDKQSTGWARVPRVGCCYFCALLSTRGAVYKSQDSALLRSDGQKYHDNCHCTVEPLWTPQGEYVAPSHVRQFEELYRNNSRGVGPEKVRNFRRAYNEQQ